MSGYSYGEDEPTVSCPYCGSECRADYCNIGVGFQQVGPFHCDGCGSSEIGPYDEPRSLTDEEKRIGWYGPDSEPGSSANVIGGKIVDHKTMKKAYEDQWTGNPLHGVPGNVERWFEKVRQP
jgi:hypothetical protein